MLKHPVVVTVVFLVVIAIAFWWHWWAGLALGGLWLIASLLILVTVAWQMTKDEDPFGPY